MAASWFFVLFFSAQSIELSFSQLVTYNVSAGESVTMKHSYHLASEMISAEVNIDGKSMKIATKHPLLVTLFGPYSTESWTVPLMYGSQPQFDTEKFLCRNSEDFAHIEDTKIANATIIISTESTEPIVFKMGLKQQSNAILSLGQPLKPKIFTPSHPVVVLINRNGSDADLMLTIESQMAHGDKKNKSKVDTGDICAVALLQADECPLRDEERLIAGSAKHLSFLHRGKMLIPHGLFRSKYLALVFLSLPHSDQCGGDLPKTNVSRHSVKLTLETIPPVNTYVIPVAVTVAFIMFLILISLVPNLLPLMIQKFRFRRIPREELINDDHDGDQDSEDVMHLELPQGNVILTGDCIWQDVANRKGRTVSTLISAKESAGRFNFVPGQIGISVIVVAIGFLIYVQQKAFHSEGNEDACYYNLGCVRSLGSATMFNSIVSSFGYFIFGIGMLIELLVSRWRHRRSVSVDAVVDDSSTVGQNGLQRNYSIMMALSWNLIAVGIFNALQSQCPSRMTFDVDVCFVVIVLLLTILKLFSARHEPINVYIFYSLSANAVVWSALGVATHQSRILVGITAFIIMFHCLHFTLQLYYSRQIHSESAFVSPWKLLVVLKKSVTSEVSHGHAKPFFPLRFTLLFILFIVQIAICAVSANYWTISYWLLINTKTFVFLYITYYFIMKLHFREKLTGEAWLNLVLFIAFWVTTIIFLLYSLKLSNMEISAAQWHQLNSDCFIGGFFDHRQMWHLCLSAALYFTAKFIWTIDDGLLSQARNEIRIF